MLNLAPPATDVWLATLPVDMRRSFDGLLALAQEHCHRNVLEGGLFVFFNKRRDRVKCVWWAEGGLVIWYQRLEQGTYEVPSVAPDQTHVTLTPTELSLLLGGIELTSVRQRKRYRPPK